MKKELSEEKDSTMDIQHFVSLIRKYKNPTEVSDLMFTELIDKIVVYESEGVGKARTQATDMMRWIGLMNNIRACADEIVLNDIVYS